MFVEHLLQIRYFWLSANQNRCFMHTFTVPGVITNCNESRRAGQTSQGKQEANYLHCTVISTKAFFFFLLLKDQKKTHQSVYTHHRVWRGSAAMISKMVVGKPGRTYRWTASRGVNGSVMGLIRRPKTPKNVPLCFPLGWKYNCLKKKWQRGIIVRNAWGGLGGLGGLPNGDNLCK